MTGFFRGITVKICLFIIKLFQRPAFLLRKSKVAWSSRVGSGAIIVDSMIGEYTYLSAGVFLHKTEIGNYCSIAAGVKIGGMEHSWWWGSTSPRLSSQCIDNKKTMISDDVWIASNAVIKQGVNVGRGAVIGANAVVLKDVEPYTIVAGVPSKVIRKRFSDEIIKEIEATGFWKYPPQKAKELLSKINYNKV